MSLINEVPDICKFENKLKAIFNTELKKAQGDPIVSINFAFKNRKLQDLLESRA
jgi:hypothetical protein